MQIVVVLTSVAQDLGREFENSVPPPKKTKKTRDVGRLSNLTSHPRRGNIYLYYFYGYSKKDIQFI